jgi:hypothetical protein
LGGAFANAQVCKPVGLQTCRFATPGYQRQFATCRLANTRHYKMLTAPKKPQGDKEHEEITREILSLCLCLKNTFFQGSHIYLYTFLWVYWKNSVFYLKWQNSLD